MTPEQEAMFQLQNTSLPGQPAQPANPMYQQGSEVDGMNQGLAQAVAYMAKNGPMQPVHRRRAKTMTQTQLEEQKMNETAGLPSNLDEATRVVALEQRVQSMDSKLDQIVGALTGNPVAPPHTPQVRPDVERPQPADPKVKRMVESPPPLRTVAPPTVTQIPEVPESPPDTSQPNWPQPASRETAPPSPLSLGPVGSQGPEPTIDEALVPGEDIIEAPSSPGEDQFDMEAIIEEDDEPTADLYKQKQLERQQILTDQVSTWLKTKDPHKFWRKFLSGACNKNLSYNAWPKEFQEPFNKRFKQMIEDPTFISTLCGRILKFQNGPLVAPHVVGAFIVVIAGMLSFALLEG